MADLQGKDFIALVRLSDGDDRTLALPGETCERVPAGKHGGTVSDALEKLLVSGLIAPKPIAAAPAPVHEAAVIDPPTVEEGAE